MNSSSKAYETARGLYETERRKVQGEPKRAFRFKDLAGQPATPQVISGPQNAQEDPGQQNGQATSGQAGTMSQGSDSVESAFDRARRIAFNEKAKPVDDPIVKVSFFKEA